MTGIPPQAIAAVMARASASGVTLTPELARDLILAALPHLRGEQRRTGTITKWDTGATHGFITEEPGGVSWFCSQDAVPRRAAIPVGTRVTFAGRPRPKPGKSYPEAFSVEVARERS